jgi:hypothetical protein
MEGVRCGGHAVRRHRGGHGQVRGERVVEGQYWLQTLGCPKNQVDSDKLEGRLIGQGYRRAPNLA